MELKLFDNTRKGIFKESKKDTIKHLKERFKNENLEEDGLSWMLDEDSSIPPFPRIFAKVYSPTEIEDHYTVQTYILAENGRHARQIYIKDIEQDAYIRSLIAYECAR